MTNALIVDQNLPLMAAWKDQTEEEEYLVVTENDNKLLSDASNVQRMKQSPVSIPGSGLNLKSYAEKVKPFQEAVRPDPREERRSYPEVSQVTSGKHNSQGLESTVDHLHPAANGGYVDILTQRGQELDFDGGKVSDNDDHQLLIHVRAHQVNPSADYSRVREVDGEHALLLLQRHTQPV